MSRPGDFDHLIGTYVVLNLPSTSQPQSFMLDTKLSEDYQTSTQQEYDEEFGFPYAVIKFTCHNVAKPAEQGFLRLYAQIPIDGTLRSKPEIRGKQARESSSHAEPQALTELHEANCTVVPKLLGVGHSKQSLEDYVPGGYMEWVAWARVPGEPLRMIPYWNRSYEYRQEVREAFRNIYGELMRGGWQPWIASLENLIYDDVGKTMYVAGFRGAGPAKRIPWSDVVYSEWGLAKPSYRHDWYANTTDWTW
ncbi:unnamed protein product [Penicillium olsonii]|nr:unnamed protein product [Penicillium olsonii]